MVGLTGCAILDGLNQGRLFSVDDVTRRDDATRPHDAVDRGLRRSRRMKWDPRHLVEMERIDPPQSS